MNAQQLHHQSVPNKFLFSVEPEVFSLMQLGSQEDGCWDEYEYECSEDSLPSCDFTFNTDAACE